jgi:ssRNA-specific RNase YbeY (16S rRNA maturation enzyme)
MSTGTTKAPNLPIAPLEYDPIYQQQLNNVLRLYFAQLDNPGPSAMSTQRVNGKIIAALNFSQYNTNSNTQILSLPTQTDLASLKIGDIYVDTSANNVLKVKTS